MEKTTLVGGQDLGAENREGNFDRLGDNGNGERGVAWRLHAADAASA